MQIYPNELTRLNSSDCQMNFWCLAILNFQLWLNTSQNQYLNHIKCPPPPSFKSQNEIFLPLKIRQSRIKKTNYFQRHWERGEESLTHSWGDFHIIISYVVNIIIILTKDVFRREKVPRLNFTLLLLYLFIFMCKADAEFKKIHKKNPSTMACGK